MNDVIDADTGEVLQPETVERSSGAAVAIARAEIDMQVATAKSYPRSLTRVQKYMQQLVTLDEDAAQECIYKLPRGGKAVVGPSIRFAEALKQSWGNCRAEAYISGRNTEEGWVEATGVFLDLETNAATKISRRRRIRDKNNRLFNDDMIIMTENAITSIAMRESILQSIPRPVWRSAYELVLKAVRGDVALLSERREKAITAFAAYGVKPEQVFSMLGVDGLEDVTADHLVDLIAAYQSIKNGEETVEVLFPAGGRSSRGAPITHATVSDALADDAPKEAAKPAEQAKASGGKPAAAKQATKPAADKPAQAAATGEGDSPTDRTTGEGDQAAGEPAQARESAEPEKPAEESPKAIEFTAEDLKAWARKGERAAKFGGKEPPKELREDPAMAPALAAWQAAYDKEMEISRKQ